AEHVDIAIVQVEFPRHNLHSSAPRHAATASRLPGRAIGHVARFGILRSENVANPLRVKGARVKVVHNGDARYLTITRVRRAFAMRAITRNSAVHVVGLASPPDPVDLIEEFV